MIGRINIILIAIALAAIYWGVEGLLHFFIFHKGTFLESMIGHGSDEIWMRLLAVLLMIVAGIIAQLYVNHRRRAKRELVQAEERWERSFRAIDEGMFLIDKDFTILQSNRAFAELVGESPGSIVGRKCYSILHGLESLPDFCVTCRAVQRHEVARAELWEPTIEKYLEVSAHPVFNSNGDFEYAIHTTRDITERKRAEMEILKSRDKLEASLDALPDLFFEVDREGLIYDHHSHRANLPYVPPEEFIGKSVGEVLPEKAASVIMKAIHEAAETGQHQGATYSLDMPSGTLWYELSIATMGDPNSPESRLIVLARDITEQKKDEEELRKSEETYRTLAGNIPQKIFLKDRNSIYISGNENYARDLGIGPEELAGKTDFDFFPRELAEKYRSDDKRIMESGKTEDIEEDYIQDGHEVFIHTVKTPVRDEEGNIVGVLGIFWDITERKKAKEKLRESEEQFRILFESSIDAILWADPETGLIINCNKAAENLFEREREEIIGSHQTTIHPPEKAEYYASQFKRHIEGKGAMDEEAEVLTRSGKVIPVRITATLVTVGEKPIMEGVFKDITESKRAAEEKERVLQDLGERVKELSCIYRLSELIEKRGITTEGILEGTVKIMPPSWQYPEITCARIVLGDEEVKTENHQETAWKQSADIMICGKKEGTVEVCYLEEMPEEDEGPFVREERNLIDAIAERLGRTIESMRASEQLRESEEFYRSLLEASPYAVTVTDLEGRITRVNPRTLELHGYQSEEELIGKSAFDLIASEEHESAMKNLQKTLEEGSTTDIEYTLVRKDGTRFYGLLSAALIRDYQEKPAAFTAITQDITEHKRAEERIRLLSEGVDSSYSGIGITGPDMSMTYVNEAFCRMWGGTPEEHVGRSGLDYFDAESQKKISEELLQLLLAHGGWQGELIGVRRDGSAFPVFLTASAIYDERENMVNMIWVFEDISERKRVEQMKAEFISTAAHELRTPLTAMVLSVEALLSGGEGKFSKQQKKIAENLGQGIDRLAKLANDLLDVTQIEAGEMTLEKEKTDLTLMIEAAAAPFYGSIKARGLTLNIDSPKKPLYAYVDPDRVLRVIHNLEDNAIKFTDKGSIDLSVRKLDNEKIELCVADTGIGIPKEAIGTVFDKFSRAHLGSDSRRSGSGLGLAICKGIIEMHDGDIRVESEEGKGSRFIVTLPSAGK